METKTVETRKLGLAAWLKMKGCPLRSVDNRTFIFESDVPIETWEMQYINSCCAKHDNELLGLKKLLQRN